MNLIIMVSYKLRFPRRVDTERLNAKERIANKALISVSTCIGNVRL